MTCLHFAARYGQPKIIELLAQNGVDLNQRATENATALHFAAVKAETAAAEMLIQLGAEVDPEGKYGR